MFHTRDILSGVCDIDLENPAGMVVFGQFFSRTRCFDESVMVGIDI